jgi:hypothetical protein
VRARPSTGGALNDFFFARSQMGMSLAFHIVFAVIGMAMPLLMAVSEGCYWGHSSVYKKLYAKGQSRLEAVGSEVDAACDFGGLRRVANDNLRSG